MKGKSSLVFDCQEVKDESEEFACSFSPKPRSNSKHELMIEMWVMPR